MRLEIAGLRGKKSPIVLDLDNNATISQLKRKVRTLYKISVHRQMYKLRQNDGTFTPLLDENRTFESYGVANQQCVLVFKDLGPQIGYRTVFFLEYLGPILIVGMYALRPRFIYPNSDSPLDFSSTSKLAILCYVLHFVKRELETFFVHRFSRPTMPLANLFKNCIYYYSFAAVIGYPLCHPQYKPPESSIRVTFGLYVFTLSEILNGVVHIRLRLLRPSQSDDKARPIPKGPLFALVSCPNYTFEILTWLGFSIMTQILFSYLFTIVGFVQMSLWAMKKHNAYLKTYGKEYKQLRRRAIVPYIL